jgi:glycosyltransferase involved in cell wall biosynthesis
VKILHLAAGNRWTGAAAPAFAEAAALREAGVDAHYAYVGGYKLQAKIGHLDFVHPIIAKAQNPFSFMRSARAIEQLLDHHGFDILHAHLTYDHWLARFVAGGWRTCIARTFHSAKSTRDPFARLLLGSTDLVCVVNTSLTVRGRVPAFTPPPLDTAQFNPDGPDVREKYGLTSGELLIASIGKLSRGRGFELVLQTYAQIRKRMTAARLMIIGHGEHRPALEAMSRELGVDPIWAGYHEDDLADHYRAADFLLFAAKGSDEGHRAVIEAMACGAVPIVAPMPGIDALVEQKLIADAATADDLAKTLLGCVDSLNDLRPRVVDRSAEFAYARAAEHLLTAYSNIL